MKLNKYNIINDFEILTKINNVINTLIKFIPFKNTINKY